MIGRQDVPFIRTRCMRNEGHIIDDEVAMSVRKKKRQNAIGRSQLPLWMSCRPSA